ncbi:GntR family transcriptional regulator [Streptomyces poonensis]|uniref:GntR family transcriptional regulator n=1 Tax=Streptomyces poonensis TaxID=68255 RepID=A0A918Q374_9ACTN|nr:GntR family transcriptional regulator [Streptomyces poonensis]GGZ32231.1 GntR family transcriptional regulator [Streptomyces poonensis]GLJ92790.1 GntR family transcriptional regulator [Streptomyces poonensis]
MEQAGPRRRDPQASAEAGTGGTGLPEIRTRTATRVPAQQRAADPDRTASAARAAASAVRVSAPARTAPAARTDTARGEHVHSEPPVPGACPDGSRRLDEPGRPDGFRPEERLRPAPGRPVVQRASVRGQILDALRAALVAGELTPGEVYSAPALGERFGVSATPVREAMQQLALEGAVEVVPNRGFRVVRRGARELAELAEIRSLLEAPVILRLGRTLPAARWAELRPLAEETARAASSGCRAAYGEADRAFHRAVLGLAGNEQLVRIADDLQRRTQLPLDSVPSAAVRAELMADAAEHLALLDALGAQDLQAAEGLVERHFGSA